MMIKYLLLFAAMLALGSGCAGDVNREPVVFVSDAFQSEGEGIVTAVVRGDYKRFAEIVKDPGIAGSAADFARSREKMLKTYGRPVLFRFLTNLRTPMLVNQIWLIDFVRHGSDGKDIQQQHLFQLIFRDDGGRAKLMGMRFI